MNSHGAGQNRRGLRRVKQATVRVEKGPYDFRSPVRTPRTGAAIASVGWVRLAGTLSPATGTWPSLSPTSVNATIYRSVSGALVAMNGTYTVYNWRNVTWAASKTTCVAPCGDGTWQVIDQDC